MKILISLLAFFVSTNVWSEPVCGGVSCTDTTITRLVVNVNGDVAVRTSGDESKLTCKANNDYLHLREGSVGFNNVYSLLLTAQTTGHPLWIRVSEDPDEDCNIIYVVSDK